MGDPDGLMKHHGLYHLFWWGHATSRDLVHWAEQPYPMAGDDGSFSYYSGSVVLDAQNTSGYGTPAAPPLIAIYTAHDKKTGLQTQRLSSSTDGVIFQYAAANPVLDVGSKAFRDPDVFWDTQTQRWIMAIAAPVRRKVQFYASADLKSWKYLSEFGPAGARSQLWEVPSLFQLAVDGQPKWILLCGMGPNRVQYFVGNFDGTAFTLDPACEAYLNRADTKPSDERALWLDAGPDFYAAKTFRNFDEAGQPTICLGWMGNWEYANAVPTSWGRGAQSIPRVLELVKSPKGFEICQHPLPEFQKLRGAAVTLTPRTIEGIIPLNEFKPAKNTYEIDATFDLTAPDQTIGLNLCVAGGHKLAIGYDAATATIFLDRRLCGDTAFSPHFPKRVAAPLPADGKPAPSIRLHLFVDQSSGELFVNDGRLVMTSLIFPEPSQLGIELFSSGKPVKLHTLTAWPLNSIWR